MFFVFSLSKKASKKKKLGWGGGEVKESEMETTYTEFVVGERGVGGGGVFPLLSFHQPPPYFLPPYVKLMGNPLKATHSM